jgi:transcriptional regulator of arginine metabolism
MRSPANKSPRSKAARRDRILEMIMTGKIRSQVELTELLIAEGFLVTQATVSRDLDDLGINKIRNESGLLAYTISQNQTRAEDPLIQVARIAQDLLISAESSANLVVLRTPPGGSQLLASALDRAISTGDLPEMLGTVAGDDTVLVITRTGDGGQSAAVHILKLAEGVGKPSSENLEPMFNTLGKQTERKRS